MCGMRRVRAQKGRAEVDVEVGVPVLDGELLERRRPVDRRHVDEHVDAAERRHRRARRWRGSRRACPRRPRRWSRAVRRRRRRRPCRRLPASSRDTTARGPCLAGQHLRDDTADAFAAGDDGDSSSLAPCVPRAVQVAILPQQLVDDDAAGGGDVQRGLPSQHRDADRARHTPRSPPATPRRLRGRRSRRPESADASRTRPPQTPWSRPRRPSPAAPAVAESIAGASPTRVHGTVSSAPSAVLASLA